LIGEVVKKRREELGLDLLEISGDLRIRYEYLKAIEENDIERLPPDVYAKGYARAYARFLGMNPEPLVAQLENLLTARRGIEPEPASVRKKLFFPRTLYVLLVLLALVIILFVAFPRNKISQLERSVPEVPAPSLLRQESPVAETPERSSPQHEDNASPPAQEQKYTLRITARQTAWLRITTDKGKTEEVLLKPAESKEWTSQKGFDLKIGNAGGVAVLLNGKDLGTLGEEGQVLRMKLPAAEVRQPLSEEIRKR
jgi:cytoskeletal protein RodZ